MGDVSKLQYAILADTIEEFKLKFATVSDVTTVWGSGINAIHYLVGESHDRKYDLGVALDILLKEGININAQNNKGQSPLHFCVLRKKPEMLKLLISRKAKVDIQDDRGGTPLWRAVFDYKADDIMLEIIKELLDAGADPDLKNNSGNSPRRWVLYRHETLPDSTNPIEWDLQPHLNW